MRDHRPDPRELYPQHSVASFCIGPHAEVVNALRRMVGALHDAYRQLYADADVLDADLVDYPRELAEAITGYLEAFMMRPPRGPWAECPGCRAARLRMLRLDPRRESWRAQCPKCGVRAWVSPTGSITIPSRRRLRPPRGVDRGKATGQSRKPGPKARRPAGEPWWNRAPAGGSGHGSE